MSEITQTIGVYMDIASESRQWLVDRLPIIVKCLRGPAPLTLFTSEEQILHHDMPCPCGHPQCWTLKWKGE